MEQRMKFPGILVLVLTLTLTILPTSVYAAGKPQLQLSANKLEVKVGKKVTVEVLVKNAPAIYGADVRLAFDPRLLEVVDADKKTEGIQVKPGKLLDADKGFFLQHAVDNEAGTIDYALTLLNPAPPAEGNGLLMRITFRAKVDGLATIAISQGLFGTQTGDTIQPTLDQVNITIGNASTPTPTLIPVAALIAPSEEEGDRSTPSLLVLAGGLAAAGVVGIGGGGWLWFRCIRRRSGL
jgi:hypothetical protein